ncbi:MAG: hypothetical protein K2J82_07080 [Muribaculaceae bacterium]|nr:hypothetical protein [Muribaculaceae bacterium]MDE6754357.1 hypothetical protein [Muribaculaceae bacterium]
MSEKELNSYRFLSGEDPTDEMLECIMKGMGKEAVSRRKAAEERMRKEVRSQWEKLDVEWKQRINSLKNA